MQPTDPTPAISAPPAQAGSNRSALMIVFLVVFIDLLGFGIVLPLLPRFANENVKFLLEGTDHGKPAVKDKQLDADKQDPLGGFIIGMLMSAFSLMQFVFAPVWGRVSDRVGRRPILLLGLAGSVVFYALLGYALSISARDAPALALSLLFAARIGAGVAGATIATAQAVIADSTPPDKRKHGMALIGAAFGIGFTFGPLIGFAATSWFPGHHEMIGYTAAGLSFLALVLGIRLLPETRRFDAAPPVQRHWLDMSALRWALGSPAIGLVIMTFFLASLGFAAFEVTLALLLRDSFSLQDDDTFLVFVYLGFVLMLTQGFLYRRLAKRVTETTFMAMGMVLMAGGVGALGGVSWLAPQANNETLAWTLLYFGLTVAVVGFAFLTPSAQALVSRRTDADRQGEVLGVNQSASAMARILGPILGVTLYKSTSDHLLPYLFGAVILLVMLPMIPRIRRAGGETSIGA